MQPDTMALAKTPGGESAATESKAKSAPACPRFSKADLLPMGGTE
jgi:hypothetical protein